MPRVLTDPQRLFERRGYVARTAIVLTTAFVLAALFNAPSLQAAAERNGDGPLRALALALSGPFVRWHESLGLGRSRLWLRARWEGGEENDSQQPSLFARTARREIPHRERVISTAPGTPGHRPILRTPTPDDPLRIWIAGDSMVRSIGPALSARADETGRMTVSTTFRVATGLLYPRGYDWPAVMLRTVERESPDVVFGLLGTNDDHEMFVNGSVLRFPTPVWQAEYHRRVAGLMESLRDKTLLVWIGLPVMGRHGGFGPRMELINSIYRDEAARHPGVYWYDTRPMFSDPQGHYTAYVPDERGVPRLVRDSDDVHFNRLGGVRLARALIQQLEEWMR